MSIQMEIQWRSALLSPYGAQGLKYVRMCAARVAESPIPANAPDEYQGFASDFGEGELLRSCALLPP